MTNQKIFRQVSRWLFHRCRSNLVLPRESAPVLGDRDDPLNLAVSGTFDLAAEGKMHTPELRPIMLSWRAR